MGQDLRTFLALLRENAPEEILTVDAEVDAKHELAAVVKTLEIKGRTPVVMFRRVKGSKFPVLCGLFSSRARIARALTMSGATLVEEYLARKTQWREPERVKAGPAQEVIIAEDQVDLAKLPIVTHCRGDSGAFITAGVTVANDPDSGVPNLGIYRMMVKDRNLLSLHVGRLHHLADFVRRAEKRGTPLPCAVVVGHHPAFFLSSQTRLPMHTSSYLEAGSLLGEPLQTTAAVSVDLDVPARAELILEGEVLPNERVPEGPFGEFTYYYGSDPAAYLFRVKTITHRRDAIYQDLHNVHCEHRLLWICPAREAHLLAKLREVLPTVQAVHIPLSGAGLHAYVSLEKIREGDAKLAIITALSADHFVKHVIVVNHDVDVTDEAQVLWAVATRVQGDRDLYVLPGLHCTPLDPSSYSLKDRFTRTGLTTKMGIDATTTIEVPFPERADRDESSVVDLTRYGL